MGGGAYVVGVGMVPFATPKKADPYDVMSEGAIKAALADAGIDYGMVQQVYAGYVFGDSTSGQLAAYRVGMTGVPVINVNNNCSTGSTALWLARQAVESGATDCVLAFGFEQMRPGALDAVWTDRPNPLSRLNTIVGSERGDYESAPPAPRWFAIAADAYMEKYGATPETFAAISVKARKHAANNPYAVFRDPVTLDDVLNSPTICGTLTKLQCAPPTCGAAAAVICSREFARKHGLRADVHIRAQAMASDTPEAEERDRQGWAWTGIVGDAARQVYEQSGIGPEDIPVVELHDCFTPNELLTYEVLGLTPEGTAEKFIADGDNTYGGRVVTNPSGGLLSKGHPLGATGMAQCAELTWQLRGEAGPRQVDGATLALQHNVGGGSSVVMTMYEKVA
ncbi:lipid-transfer protein [Haloechinothrix halophila]|uniref:lipid-transfer protein n=1 Tax=Haloechinothrix halophila TaxID=1069073 RepID=UPI0004228EBA|nr:lipid-transfer protein [Haloechinothrix halophila]